jgi:DNA-binding transcriptional MerR regulator
MADGSQTSAPAGPPAPPPRPKNLDGWLTLREAADKTGLSPHTIRAYGHRGKVRCEKGPRGEPLYDPESLPIVGEDANAHVEVIKTQTHALREAHGQVILLTEKIIGMAGLVDRVLQTSETQIAKLNDRCDRQDAELRAARELIDQVQSHENERAMARAAFDASQRRAQQIADQLVTLAKPVVSSLMFSLAPGARAVQESILAELLEDFDDDQIGAILDAHPKTSNDAAKRAAVLEMRKALKRQRAEREKQAAEAADKAAASKDDKS